MVPLMPSSTLDGNESHRIRDQGEQEGSDRQDTESNEQQWTAAPALGLTADPWRREGYENLQHDDEDRHREGRLPSFVMSQHSADQRQYRCIGHLEQEQASSEGQEIAVLPER
jgi:hypothetical protein